MVVLTRTIVIVSLNPLSAGRSFQTEAYRLDEPTWFGLNPLSAGRSFQTPSRVSMFATPHVLIPYQQGGLFRRQFARAAIVDGAS